MVLVLNGACFANKLPGSELGVKGLSIRGPWRLLLCLDLYTFGQIDCFGVPFVSTTSVHSLGGLTRLILFSALWRR